MKGKEWWKKTRGLSTTPSGCKQADEQGEISGRWVRERVDAVRGWFQVW